MKRKKISSLVRNVYKAMHRLFGMQVFADGRWNDIVSVNETLPTDTIHLTLEDGS